MVGKWRQCDSDYASPPFWKNSEHEYGGAFFSIRYAGQESLFEGFAVWKEKNYRQIQGTYLVISLSFANIKENNYQTARKKYASCWQICILRMPFCRTVAYCMKQILIISKAMDEIVGTIELFHRDADDYFTNCGLLRLDIRSDYEISDEIVKILELIIEPAYRLFQCDKIATKAVVSATERISVLENLGFQSSREKLIGHDGTEYDSYFVLKQN